MIYYYVQKLQLEQKQPLLMCTVVLAKGIVSRLSTKNTAY